MQYVFRPAGAWTEGDSPDRRHDVFRASWPSTLNLLARELDHLDAHQIVLQVDVTEADLRLDGMPRAHARPGHPGVRIAFDSKYGPLTYATDAYHDWRANVRAIALGLEALRKVDRYGVTKRGEQYTGWKQRGAGAAAPVDGAMSRSFALMLIEEILTKVDGSAVSLAGADELALRRALRRARGATHPDVNAGDSTLFLELERAGRALGLVT